jgi:peptidyl-prolyl cis-trans isomerase-like 2
MLARAGKYDNCLFHRLVPGFMVRLAKAFFVQGLSIPYIAALQIQSGDPTGTGAGGESYWDTPFRDEHDLKGAARHDGRGVLAMANKGPGTNGQVEYFRGNNKMNTDLCQITILLDV